MTAIAMTPEIAAEFADHNARITSCEGADKRVEARLDKLIFLMIGTLMSAVGGLVVGLIALLKG